MNDQYFVFRDAAGVPIHGYGTEREAAAYLAHLNRHGNRYTVRPLATLHLSDQTLEDIAASGISLGIALSDIAETA
jgi:hypothetical protein